MFSTLLIASMPLLIVTLLLGLEARWHWHHTMDKILRGMKVKDVEKQIARAASHNQWARFHAIAVTIGILATLLGFGFGTLFIFIWIYGLFAPHMLALLLYHIRWNPATMQRKQKLDAEDAQYQGDYSLDPHAQYGINEEGELELLSAMHDEAQEQQQS